MTFQHRLTSNGRPRGLRVDAETRDRIYLIKKVSCLRATYQVRLAALRAHDLGKRLAIRTPRGFAPHPSLTRLIEETGNLILIERL